MAAQPTGMVVFTVAGPLARDGVPALCRRLRVLLETSGASVAVCDLDARVEAGLCTLEALARLQLTARRLGRELQLRDGPEGLRELVELVGLGEVVPPCPCGLRIEERGR